MWRRPSRRKAGGKTIPLCTGVELSLASLSPGCVTGPFAGRPLRSYRPPKRRWGSVLGPQRDGLEVFAPNGRAFRFPAWSFDRVLMPLIVRWGIYRGVRDNRPLS